jgi:hypothetical protein
MTSPAELLLERVRQIESCVQDQDFGSMLLLSQALRQLLIDGDRLVVLVNRNYRIPLEFTVGFSSKEREAEMRALGLPDLGLHFLGAFPPNEPRRKSSLKEFLGFPIAKFEGGHFSVATLIKACANRFGGVHVGEPTRDTAEESDVRRFGEKLSELGMQHAFSSLIIVATVTLDALEPLIGKIEQARCLPMERR